MKKAYLSFLCSLVVLSNCAFSQTLPGKSGSSGAQGGGKGYHVNWTTDPFDNQVFIENNGQFDGKTNSGEKVLYGVQLGKINIYFTSNKVIYRYDKYYFVKPKDAKGDPDDKENFRHEVHVMKAEWENADRSVSITAKNELKNYYTYPDGQNKSFKANIFKQIVYNNLYPGVDAVYQFVKGKNGIKYSLIVHPGADISKIKLAWSGLKNMVKNKDGDIVISGELNEFTEHAPVTTYEGESGNIPFSNIVAGNTESFKADAEYDNTKTLVIDPWQTDPLFIPVDKAYDLDWDYYGNVYAYGGDPQATLQEVKMDKTGTILWTFNATAFPGSYYGDIAINKVTGTSYITEGYGGEALKVNTNGMLLLTFTGTSNLNELWRAEYDACNGDIIIAGGGTGGVYQAGVLDSNMTTVNPVNIMNVSKNCHDDALMALDPNGNFAYIASARSLYVDPLYADNVIMKLPLPSLSPTIYATHETMHFMEVSSVYYAGGAINNAETNSMNGAAASPSWLYLYNGDTLGRYDKNTGINNRFLPIRNFSPYRFGGLDADPCDNLFLGVADSMYVIDSTNTITSKIPLPDTVFDIHIGQLGALYACGMGYVTQITEPISVRLISSTVGSPTSCSACNGTATVNVNCGIAPYNFSWSDGSTNETDTGMCAGLYTVTVTDGACPPHSDTAIINISGKSGYGASVKDTNPNCALSKGNIIVYPFGGSSPYTYSWSNGETNQKDTGLIAGTYVCTITDSSGCRYEVAVTLVNPVTPTITIVPKNDSICSGSNVPLTATGLKTYTWIPNTGLSCYNCPNPTATPTATTTYTVSGADSNGCTATTTTTIKVYTTPKPVIHGMDSICAGHPDTLTVSGGTKYLWSNSSTSSSIVVSPNTTKTITVTAYNGVCSHDTSFTIHIVSPAAAISASKDSTCAGDTVKLSGSGGTTFKWSTSGTSSSIIVSPTVPTTYTLYAAYGTCKDSATVTIGIIKSVTATVSVINDTVCLNGTTTITANSSGGQATYLWSNGATTSSITVSDTATTTYTAAVTGKCNTVPLTQKVVVVPLAKPIISGTSVKCKGVKDTLTVSGGTSYLWSNGKTTTNYFTGAINADSTIKVYAFNSLGCKDSTSFKITVRTPPIITITPPTAACAGSDVLLTAKATGTGPFTYSWSPGGATTDTITVNPISATTYTVVVSNGCKSTKTTVVTPSSPSITACCSKTIVMGDDTTIVAYGDSLKSYSWNPSVICLNPPLCDSVKVTPTITTTFTVTGTDSKGCQVSHIVTITVETPCFDFVVPNVITPNDPGPQGLNGMFYIKTTNLSYWSLVIFDRWGKEIYKSNNPNEYWTGTTEGGSKATDGVYYYIINATCQGNTYKKDGFLQLIR